MASNDRTQYPITAYAVMEIPTGGSVTMKGTPEQSFEDAVKSLEETHELYIASNGWGGGR